MKIFGKKTEEEPLNTEESAAEEEIAAKTEVDEETKRRVIEEYLKTAAAQPAAVFVSGNAVPKTPVKKPRTIAEAAMITKQMMKENKGE